VDWERLTELTDGSSEGIRELVDFYVEQTTQQLQELGAAIRNKATDDVRRLAHSCAGSSATCGIVRLVPLLRELETRADAGQLAGTDRIFHQTDAEFRAVRAHLAHIENRKAAAVH
jgi:HPt (histidine-containing phosphotransfer) domain-containing protein